MALKSIFVCAASRPHNDDRWDPDVNEMSMSADFDELDYWQEGHLAWIRFKRPDSLNAFTTRTYAQLRLAIRTAELNPEIDVLAITGSGRAFATGGDLKELLGYLKSDRPLDMMGFVDNTPMATLRASPLTTIAAVNGICVAGGLIVSALSDIVVASEGATFGLPEVRMGLAEAISVSALYPHIGLHRLKYLALTGKIIDAKTAEYYGMVNEVVSSDELLQRVSELASELSKTDKQARSTYKGYLDKLAPPIDFSTTVMPGMDIGRLVSFAEKE